MRRTWTTSSLQTELPESELVSWWPDLLQRQLVHSLSACHHAGSSRQGSTKHSFHTLCILVQTQYPLKRSSAQLLQLDTCLQSKLWDTWSGLQCTLTLIL